jgi:hypothetical protein
VCVSLSFSEYDDGHFSAQQLCFLHRKPYCCGTIRSERVE